MDAASRMGSKRPLTFVSLKISILLFAIVYSNCSRIEHKYTRILDNRIQSTFDHVTAMSAPGCCAKCNLHGSCTSVNFRKSSGQCELSTVALKDVAAGSASEADWVTYSRTDNADWIVVFNGIADIGTDLYEAWVSATNVTTNDVNCMFADVTSCNAHFRNKLLDTWEKLRISEVRLSLYKDQAEVAHILFSGTGSNFTNWFSPQRVMSSTWTGIDDPNLLHSEVFTMQGQLPSRRFYINQYHNGCPNDPMVLLVLSSDYYWCPYDKHPSYPRIMYSPTNTWANPYNVSHIDFADSLMISIRTT